MLFTYQARDAQGAIRDGELSAASAEEASQQLRQDGMYLMSLDETDEGAKSTGLALFRRRVSRGEIIYMTNQLAVMVDAGIPLATALEGIARQAENPTLREMISEIQMQVEGGEDLSSALAKFPKYFDTTYVNLVKASEASGTLAHMLERISEQSRADEDTRQKVLGALMYPGAMLVMCVGVCIFLLSYVFPKLTPMFEAKSMDLPGPTKLMMVVSFALTHYWYLFIVGIVLAVAGFAYMRRQWWGRLSLDWMWLNMPILGPMMRKVTISRSLRTLATTVNAGVPMLESLELSSGVANNIFYARCWQDVRDQVTSGRQIHEALEGSSLFPPTLIQMISSGEQTGKLGQILEKVSGYFDREVDNAIKAATSLIEPIMVMVMGSVIGTIALAMLLPIFKLSSGH